VTVPGIGRIPEPGHAGDSGRHLPEQLQPFPRQSVGHKSWPGDVSPRPCEAGDESGGHGIRRTYKDNRDRLGRALGSLRRRHASVRHDDGDLQTDQLRGKVEKPFGLPLGPSVFDRDALAFHMGEVAERLPEEIEPTADLGVKTGKQR
jgi:hypothetical protein